MAPSSRVCPHCHRLNSAQDRTCYHCNTRLPSKLTLQVRELIAAALGVEQPGARFFVILCVAVYLLSVMRGEPSLMGGIPRLEAFRWGALLPSVDQPWRYLSAMFVHLGVLHILFNMITLNDLGRLLERQLGSGRFLCAFLGTGIAGFVFSDVWYTFRGELGVMTAGASGGLFGLIGVLIGALYARRDPVWKRVLGRVVVYALSFALVFPVNNAAHGGGLVAGCLLGYLFGKERVPPRWRTSLYNAIALVLVIASLVSIVLSHLAVRAMLQQQAARPDAAAEATVALQCDASPASSPISSTGQGCRRHGAVDEIDQLLRHRARVIS